MAKRSTKSKGRSTKGESDEPSPADVMSKSGPVALDDVRTIVGGRTKIVPRTAPLSRAEMEGILAKGQSVLYRGEIITRVADLPAQADIDANTQQAEAKAANRRRRGPVIV